MNDNLSNDLEEQDSNPSHIIPADDDLPEAVNAFEDESPLADDVVLEDDYILDTPNGLDFTFSASGLDELDIEGALASITGLDAAIAEHQITDEEAPAVEPEPALDPEQVRRETESRHRAIQQASGRIEQPSLRRVGRGQLASLVPAVLLMMLGAGLTVYLAEPSVFEGVVVNGGTFAMLLAGMFGVMLISYWLSSGRWASGALFVGLSLLISLGVVIVAPTVAPDAGWIFLLSGVGVSVFLSGLLSRGTGKYQYFVGLALFVAGLAGYGFLLNSAQFDMPRLQPFLLGGVGLFLALLLIAPLFVKKQR